MGQRFAALLALAAASHASLKHKHGGDVAHWVRDAHGGERNEAVGAAQRRVAAALADLEKYYGGDRALLSAATLASKGLAATLDARLADLLVGTGDGRKFVVGALGSSVTAGHDGFGSTAWPAVMRRRLALALEPAGIDVEVRNQAVGGREPFPASLCVSTLAGDDADLVIREWEYWDWNDGLPDGHGVNSEAGLEVFVRNALSVASAPAVFFLQLDADGPSHRSKELVKIFGPEGKLSAYGDARGVGVFSAFGAAFDHLRAAAPPKRLERNGKKECSGRNIGDCPLTPNPDGYHTRPLFTGLEGSMEGVQDPSALSAFVDPAKLFINWHPGSLGHEVMGHQMAYAVLQAARRGLLELAKTAAPGAAPPPPPAAAPPLPPPALCGKSKFCGGAVRCAMSTLPKAQAPDVGDWVFNGTATTKWKNAPTDQAFQTARTCGAPSKACAKNPAAQDCYHYARQCSYADSKRAFSGTSDDGALVLKAPPGACALYLSEPGFAWSKPKNVANWHVELDVRIDGKECGKFCTVHQARGAYIQNLEIDLSGGPRGRGGCADAEVSLSVKPAPSLAAWETETGTPVCKVARNGRCEPAEKWRRYVIECAAAAAGARTGDACALKPGKPRDPSTVAAFVTSAVAW